MTNHPVHNVDVVVVVVIVVVVTPTTGSVVTVLEVFWCVICQVDETYWWRFVGCISQN